MLDWLVVDQVMRYLGFDLPSHEKKKTAKDNYSVLNYFIYFLVPFYPSTSSSRLTVWRRWEIKFRHLDEL